MIPTAESPTHKHIKETARSILRGMGFEENQIHEEYPVTIKLTDKEIDDFARWEAQEKWETGAIKEAYRNNPGLQFEVERWQKLAYENAIRKLKATTTYKVDIAGISPEKKVAIECRRVSPKIKTEILRKEFDTVIKIPPVDLRKLSQMKSGKKDKMDV